MAPPDTLVTLRSAVREDFPEIARLLVQLYDFELPGALTGPHDCQRSLLQFTLEARQAQGLKGRYVVCNAAGAVIATATMEYPDATPYDRAPHGVIRQSLELLGYRATAHLLLTIARSLVPVPRPKIADAIWLHSMVVDERYRRQGIGQMMMRILEQQAHEQGYRSIWLQVLAMNHASRHLYQQLGYRDVWSAPHWQQVLTWPSYLMCKALLEE